MRTRIILLFITLCSGFTCMFGQDIMTLRDGQEMEVIVTEVGKYEVWFKKYNHPDGPVYSLPVTDIFMIKYPDGNKDVFGMRSFQNRSQYAPNYKRKEPIAACLFSMLIPGGGQYYNGEIGKGIVMTGIWALAYAGMAASVNNMIGYDYNYNYYNYNDTAVDTGFALCALLLVGDYIWSIVDAPMSANRINEKNRLLSWNVGKNANLSLKPDINLTSYSCPGNAVLSPNYGLKLTLSLR